MSKNARDRRATLAAAAILLLAACASSGSRAPEPATPADSLASAADTAAPAGRPGEGTGEVALGDPLALGDRRMPPPPPRAMRLAFTDSLKQPESVKHDAEQDVFFVSNINGRSLGKDRNGFISRLTAEGVRDSLRWVESGRDGVTLHAPKGMAIVGDTLWVADIDVVRGFDRKSGLPVGTIDLSKQGAVFLNDIAVGGDGAIYITDTQLRSDARGLMSHPRTDRIFRIGPDRVATIALQSDRLGRPNGIAWDRANDRFVVVPFDGDTIMTFRPGDTAPSALVAAPRQLDGVVVTDDGRLLVASQSTSSVHLLRGERLIEVLEQLPSVADIEYDEKRGRLVVPLLSHNRVEFYALPPGTQ